MQRGTPVFNDAQALEDIFEGMLSKWLPAFASNTRLHYTTHDPATSASTASNSVDHLDAEGASKRKKPRLE
jgi:hypothetical protein